MSNCMGSRKVKKMSGGASVTEKKPAKKPMPKKPSKDPSSNEGMGSNWFEEVGKKVMKAKGGKIKAKAKAKAKAKKRMV